MVLAKLYWRILSGLLGGLLGGVLAVEDPAEVKPSEPEQIRFFENHVRPILFDHCLECHGDKKQWGGLRLDSREAALRGGDSGPAIVPGKPQESLLIRAIRHVDDLKMPKEGKLNEQEITKLEQWIHMGAPHSEKIGAAKRTRDPNHWAFQSTFERPLPEVHDAHWPRSGLDAFILAKLEEVGLSPAPMADKRTLIRRVTFDLIGLPPTPEEIEAYLADESPEAFSRVVDRLIASPRYGQRGR